MFVRTSSLSPWWRLEHPVKMSASYFELKLVADNLALHWAILSDWRLWTSPLHEWKSLKLRVPHSSLHWADHSNSSFLKCEVISTQLCTQTQNAVKVMCSSFCRWLLKLQTGLKCFIYWALTGKKSIGSVKYCNEGVILSGCTTYTVWEALQLFTINASAWEQEAWVRACNSDGSS